MKTIRKVPVSERAIVERINRKFLKEDGPAARLLKKTRGVRAKLDLGDYYVLDTKRNFIVEHHSDPVALGRELGVVSASEECFEEE